MKAIFKSQLNAKLEPSVSNIHL